jgi:hypothetical protein
MAISPKSTSGPRRCEHVRRHNFRLARQPATIAKVSGTAKFCLPT